MNFYIVTLGCKVNQYESEVMSEMLVKAGYMPSDSYLNADICLINSCTVTATGDAKCRKVIHRINRENPSCIVILTGCMPQAFSEDTSIFEGCDIVLGNTSRREVVAALEEYLVRKEPIIRITPHEKNEAFETMTLSRFQSRTRAYIKIEDGCNRFCTYCIIPYARGRVRSKRVEDIRIEAEKLAQNGFHEIVLVGINLSAFGQDTGEELCDAVSAVCAAEGVNRVRLGSIEPERMTRDVLQRLSREEKFCPHFHLSLQSGCDATLVRMRRHYTTNEYREIVENIREIFENSSVTTDVMVGFVGETEEEFRESLAFCDEIGFAKAHVFAYSRRKGTKADQMDGQIPESVKNERSKIMIAHTNLTEKTFLSSQIGKTVSVLFETKDKDGLFEGYTENYTKVKVQSDADLSNRLLDVCITQAKDDYCLGELLR
ncbi:MAG: tRNA (N(6)-L-threonylcarbamoyladenosine(37)-C(2))-methylthiotransferase MtaB [Ruminococcus sp.]|nr:tRNA (N(6)-L-threonylcarbamoyladenosine(37)-C(2))-methylthiotransferase MtaB [Ruminococcus sp.]